MSRILHTWEEAHACVVQWGKRVKPAPTPVQINRATAALVDYLGGHFPTPDMEEPKNLVYDFDLVAALGK